MQLLSGQNTSFLFAPNSTAADLGRCWLQMSVRTTLGGSRPECGASVMRLLPLGHASRGQARAMRHVGRAMRAGQPG